MAIWQLSFAFQFQILNWAQNRFVLRLQIGQMNCETPAKKAKKLEL
jgi:hypothetical protein